MSKAARIRARHRQEALSVPVTASTGRIGPGRPRGRARAATRNWGASTAPSVVDPWQGFGNAIVLGRSKVARWKRGRNKNEIKNLNSYIGNIFESGQVKTLADVVTVRENDDRERGLKSTA